ncbi:MAG: hypothetical protein LC637_10020 [Xanthomonadaceae bacterium]|nr:hypothetical protein [Xanthomonadaceae bacterium]
MRETDLEVMLQASDLVVLGRAESVEGYWRGKKIYTLTVVSVDETIKGDAPSRLEIHMLGGTAMHPRLGLPVSMAASASVSFSPGETFVLLLDQDVEGGYRVIGMTQGKIPVITDPDTGERWIPIGPHKLGTLGDDTGDTATDVRLGSEQMRLEEFLLFIRQRIEAGGGRH